MAAANSRKKQDEKHLKMLRELAAQPANKQCFDCHQRGPTYVNMATGSFVCTSCSGILRGLNPPHRVKSISMASFSPEEIEFIRNRGNEWCRQVWLGLYDSQTTPEPEGKDEQLVKDFMCQKYERKRWYVDPRNIPQQPQLTSPVHSPLSASAVSLNSVSGPAPAIPQSISMPETKPLSSILGNNIKPLVVQKGKDSSVTVNSKKSTNDLLGELGLDPFSSPVSVSSSSVANANANFANFDNFPSSGSNLFPPLSSNNNGLQQPAAVMLQPPAGVPSLPVSAAVAVPIGGPPPKDKYAALEELDNLFHSNQVPSSPMPVATVTAPTSEWEAPVPMNPFSTVGTSPMTGNPFLPMFNMSSSPSAATDSMFNLSMHNGSFSQTSAFPPVAPVQKMPAFPSWPTTNTNPLNPFVTHPQNPSNPFL